MAGSYLVRYGRLGSVAPFFSPGESYRRYARVVVRGSAGLHLGQVLTETSATLEARPDGQILRPATSEDELLAARLDQRRAEAIAACQDELRRRNENVVVLDAEYTLDASQLCFYFLGDLPSGASEWIDELAELFGARVQLERFAKSLDEGCGPDCGTESAEGCSSSGCVSCSLSSACRK